MRLRVRLSEPTTNGDVRSSARIGYSASEDLMANSELWCVICESLVETEGMILARDFRGNGKASRATYLGKDVAHVVLNAEHSKKYKPKIIVVPKSIVVNKEVPPLP